MDMEHVSALPISRCLRRLTTVSASSAVPRCVDLSVLSVVNTNIPFSAQGGSVWVRATEKIGSLHEVRRKNKSQRYVADGGEDSS